MPTAVAAAAIMIFRCNVNISVSQKTRATSVGMASRKDRYWAEGSLISEKFGMNPEKICPHSSDPDKAIATPHE